MNVVAIRCPNCNGSVELDQDREFGFCVYCGTKIFIPNVVQRVRGTVSIDNSSTLASLLILANRSRQISQYEEALRHYDAIMVIDPNNNEAVLFKGLCTIAVGNPVGLSYLLSYGSDAFSRMLDQEKERAEERIMDALHFLGMAAERFLVSIRAYERERTAAYVGRPPISGDIMNLAQVWESLDERMDESFMTMSTSLLDAYCGVYSNIRSLLDWNRQKEKARKQVIPSIERRMAAMDEYRRSIKKNVARTYWGQRFDEYTGLQNRLSELKRELRKNPGVLRKVAVNREIKTIRNRLDNPC